MPQPQAGTDTSEDIERFRSGVRNLVGGIYATYQRRPPSLTPQVAARVVLECLVAHELPPNQAHSWLCYLRAIRLTADELISILTLDLSAYDERLGQEGWGLYSFQYVLRDLVALIEPMAEQEVAALVARRAEPWGVMASLLEVALVLCGHLPRACVPPSRVADFAHSHVCLQHELWLRDAAITLFGEAQWLEALAKEAIINHNALTEVATMPLAACTPPELLRAVAARVTPPESSVRLLTAAGPRMLPLLGEALRSGEWRYAEAVAWLRLSNDPAPMRDVLAEGLAGKKPHGSDEGELVLEVARCVALPQREAALRGWWRWCLVPACPTPWVLQTAVETVQGWNRPPHSRELFWAIRSFKELGEAAGAALRAALSVPKATRRGFLLECFAPLATVEDLPMLELHLSDSLPDTREAAALAAARLPAPALAVAVRGWLRSRKRTTRLGAVEVIYAMPPGTVRAELLQEAEARIQHPDAVVRLARAREPMPPAFAQIQALRERLSPQDTATVRAWLTEVRYGHLSHRLWSEYGAAIIPICMDEWRAGLRRGEDSARAWFVTTNLSARANDEEKALLAWARVFAMAGRQTFRERGLSPLVFQTIPYMVPRTPNHAEAPIQWLLRHHRLPVRKRMLEWLDKACGDEATPSFVDGLRDPLRDIRDHCVKGVRRRMDVALPQVIELLSHPTAAVQISAAAALRGVPAAADALTSARRRARSRVVQDALEDALRA